MEFFNFGARREYQSFVASQTCDFLLVDNGETSDSVVYGTLSCI